MNKQAVELLKRVREVILAHPDNHYQSSFVDVPVERESDELTPETLCGTTLCWAGWTMLLHNGSLLRDPYGFFYVPLGDGEMGSILFEASRILDLTLEEECTLFLTMDEEESIAYAESLIQKYGSDE